MSPVDTKNGKPECYDIAVEDFNVELDEGGELLQSDTKFIF